MTNDRVVYNGMEMAAEWPARIEAAQKIHSYIIGGTAYERIRYSQKEGSGVLAKPCHDCGVIPGQYHVELVCDMEECPRCHEQVIGCDCHYEADECRDGVEMTGESEGIAVADWRALLKMVEPETSGYTIFLETASGRFVPLESEQTENVVGLVITWIRNGVPPSKTEDPARHLSHRLSERFGLNSLVLLSRSLESFVGYYVRIRP